MCEDLAGIVDMVRERLKARLGGIVGDQLGAVARDRGLALGVQCRRDYQ